MSLSELKRRTYHSRTDSNKLSGPQRGDFSTLIVTGSVSNKPRAAGHSLLALTHKSKGALPNPQVVQLQRLQGGCRRDSGKLEEIVIRGTAKSLKPVPMKKSWKLESGTLSLSVTTAEPFPGPSMHMSAASSPAPTLGLPRLRTSKSSCSLRPSLLPPLNKPVDSPNHTPSPTSSSREIWPYSKRLFLQQRDDMASQNLIILVFDGVLGDSLRLEVWDRRPPVLHLRPNAVKGLIRLLGRFQVVLFIQKPTVKAKRLLAYFLKVGIVFDGVYRSRNSWKTRPRMNEDSLPNSMLKYVQNYDQVYTDFRISEPSKESLIISTLKLCEEEASDLEGVQLLYHQISDIRYEVYVTGVPVGEESPVTVVFPDPLCRENQMGASFSDISEYIFMLLEMLPAGKNGTVNWQDLYWTLRTCHLKCKSEVVSTAFFHDEVMLKQLLVAPTHVRTASLGHSHQCDASNEVCFCEMDNCLTLNGQCRNKKRFIGMQLLGKKWQKGRNVFVIPDVKTSVRYEVVERDAEVSLFLEKKAERERRPSKRVTLIDI